MEIAKFFYKVFAVDKEGKPQAFLGSAFPVAPNGGLLTCRHVVSVDLPDDQQIAVLDNEEGTFSPVSDIVLPSQSGLDLAFLHNALGRPKSEFFPILTPKTLVVGENVFCFGFFATGGKFADVEQGYFSGRIVNFFSSEPSPISYSLMLPFPILEGMSGSPILTYHNGTKLVGIGYGNRSSRILVDHEILTYKDERREYKETIHRIVEFGIAYHCATIINFLSQIGVKGFVVSDEQVNIPGLS